MLNLSVNHAQPVAVLDYCPMESMGDRIKQLRIARRLTQSELGEQVGVGKSAVSQWESGATKDIRLNHFMGLLAALGTDPEYLIWGADRAPEKGNTKARWGK